MGFCKLVSASCIPGGSLRDLIHVQKCSELAEPVVCQTYHGALPGPIDPDLHGMSVHVLDLDLHRQ